MKVLNLCCSAQHRFEGWFASEADYADQTDKKRVACPLCGDTGVQRLPSAPHVLTSSTRATAPADEVSGGVQQGSAHGAAAEAARSAPRDELVPPRGDSPQAARVQGGRGPRRPVHALELVVAVLVGALAR